jgi:hypothetical protein
MHYNGSCAPAGGNTISNKDHLGAEIMYPPSSTVEISRALHSLPLVGGELRVIRENTLIRTDWRARGALDGVFSNIEWTATPLFGTPTIVSSTPDFFWDSAVGNGLWIGGLDVAFEDPKGRTKSGSVTIVASNAIHASIVMSIL